MLRTLYCLLLVQFFSCSPRLLEVKQTHYFHDNYLLFRKNGFYSNKALVLGVFRLPDFQRGRYAMQRDSVYFIRKNSRTDFTVYAYGYIDTVRKQFHYRHIDSTAEEIYYITEMPTRKRDREHGFK
jgi:hypothetical protein